MPKRSQTSEHRRAYMREYMRMYRREKPDVCERVLKKYAKTHKAVLKKRWKKWRDENLERAREISRRARRKMYRNNPEKENARRRAWYYANLKKARASARISSKKWRDKQRAANG